MSITKKVYWILGIMIVSAIGFLLIPRFMKKCSNKIYKSSLKNDEIDIDSMEPEIVRKEEKKED